MGFLAMFLISFFSYIPLALLSCMDDGVEHGDGEKWVRNGNFLVTCAFGEIKVLNCLTDTGTILELGTISHVENGVEYSCVDDEPMFEEKADGSDDIVIGNFLICCISKRFKGCIDEYGDWIKTGHFVLGKGLLKYCNIQKGGKRARIEPRGAYEMRCGDEGIHVHKCYVQGKPVYVGQAWIDAEGTSFLNIMITIPGVAFSFKCLVQNSDETFPTVSLLVGFWLFLALALLNKYVFEVEESYLTVRLVILGALGERAYQNVFNENLRTTSIVFRPKVKSEVSGIILDFIVTIWNSARIGIGIKEQ
uniref:Ig-like domain-containing protein n=1 Tax=Angiostrongylus cantonensis TaxID=6313 RepID=A0A0K0DA86_ANGCA